MRLAQRQMLQITVYPCTSAKAKARLDPSIIWENSVTESKHRERRVEEHTNVYRSNRRMDFIISEFLSQGLYLHYNTLLVNNNKKDTAIRLLVV